MFNYPVHAVVLANSLNSHVMNYLTFLGLCSLAKEGVEVLLHCVTI
jgi:hypothetical protein